MTKGAQKRQARLQRRRDATLAAEAMPTTERLQHAGDAFEIGGVSGRGRGGTRIVRILDAPIERLLSERKLSDAQYEALRLMRVHWLLGNLAGNLQSVDLDRVPQEQSNLASVERGLMHREAFYSGWELLNLLQKICVNSVVLIETPLAITGAGLGYASPYRGRLAVLGYLHDAADELIRAFLTKGR
jgi:hypothetical protein